MFQKWVIKRLFGIRGEEGDKTQQKQDDRLNNLCDGHQESGSSTRYTITSTTDNKVAVVFI